MNNGIQNEAYEYIQRIVENRYFRKISQTFSLWLIKTMNETIKNHSAIDGILSWCISKMGTFHICCLFVVLAVSRPMNNSFLFQIKLKKLIFKLQVGHYVRGEPEDSKKYDDTHVQYDEK